MLSKLSPKSILMVLASAVFGRAATAISQIIAAFYLTPDQFGVYAAGVGVLIVTGLLRGGGTGNHMLTMKPEEFQQSGGRYFRYSLAFALLTLALSLGAAWPVAGAFASSKGYPETELRNIIILLGVQFATMLIGQYPRARMSADLRFSELSIIDIVTGAIRLGATWLLASWGWGALALAVPVLCLAVCENAWIWPRCRLNPGELKVQPGWFNATLLEMRLPLVMAILATLNAQSDTLIGSVLLPLTVVGVYFFAMQLAAQPAQLVAGSLRSVLSPATAAVRGDREREMQSIRDTFNAGMVFSPIVSMSIPAVFDAFERAVWHGKWADSRWPVFILSALLTYPTVVQLVVAPISGIRDWGAAIRLDLGRALAKILGASVAAVFILWLKPGTTTSATILALFVGGISAAVATYEIFRVMLNAGMSSSSIVYELYSTPLAALLSAVAASGLAHSVVEPLRADLPANLANVIECGLAAFAYAALSLVLLRFGYTAALERVVNALPAPVAGPIRKVMVL
jgi:O-antigen/teichoic acid export membrane protein